MRHREDVKTYEFVPVFPFYRLVAEALLNPLVSGELSLSAATILYRFIELRRFSRQWTEPYLIELLIAMWYRITKIFVLLSCLEDVEKDMKSSVDIEVANAARRYSLLSYKIWFGVTAVGVRIPKENGRTLVPSSKNEVCHVLSNMWLHLGGQVRLDTLIIAFVSTGLSTT